MSARCSSPARAGEVRARVPAAPRRRVPRGVRPPPAQPRVASARSGRRATDPLSHGRTSARRTRGTAWPAGSLHGTRDALHDLLLGDLPGAVVVGDAIDPDDRQQHELSPTPAFAAAEARFPVAAVKNSMAALAVSVSMLATSITASAPTSACSSPLPVTRSTPCDRLRTTASCPAVRTASTVRRPTVPVPPATAILMRAPLRPGRILLPIRRAEQAHAGTGKRPLATMATVTTSTVRPGIAERLSQMIRLPTVSAELDERGAQPFEDFVALIAELYPLHPRAARRSNGITAFGLLFRWAGRRAGIRRSGRADGALRRRPGRRERRLDAPAVRRPRSPTARSTDAARWTTRARSWSSSRRSRTCWPTGFTPARDVYLSFGGNEETYGAAAAEIARAPRARHRPLARARRGRRGRGCAAAFVPGRAAMIGVGEKGVMTLRLSARGDGGHASAPPRSPRSAHRPRARSLAPARSAARTPAAITRMLRSSPRRHPGARTASAAAARHRAPRSPLACSRR